MLGWAGCICKPKLFNMSFSDRFFVAKLTLRVLRCPKNIFIPVVKPPGDSPFCLAPSRVRSSLSAVYQKQTPCCTTGPPKFLRDLLFFLVSVGGLRQVGSLYSNDQNIASCYKGYTIEVHPQVQCLHLDPSRWSRCGSNWILKFVGLFRFGHKVIWHETRCGRPIAVLGATSCCWYARTIIIANPIFWVTLSKFMTSRWISKKGHHMLHVYLLYIEIISGFQIYIYIYIFFYIYICLQYISLSKHVGFFRGWFLKFTQVSSPFFIPVSRRSWRVMSDVHLTPHDN